MHIYIDESGIFRPDKNSKGSLVAALVIPSSKKVRLSRDYLNLSANWPREKGEVKGRLLNEDHVAQVVKLLQNNDVLLEINAVDAGLQTEQQLLQVKQSITKIMRGWATPGHPLTGPFTKIAQAYESMSLQLFIQAFLMQSLIYRVIQNSISYYARRLPKELGAFHWVIDRKDKTISEYEWAWAHAIFPSLAFQAEKEPFELLVGGDYSYLQRFASTNLTALTRARPEPTTPEDTGMFQLKKIIGKSFKFAESKNHAGLQLVDILANAVRRAFDGNLQKEGWRDIGTLIVHRPLQAIPFILLEDKHGVRGTPRKIDHPFAPVVNELSKNNKVILLDAIREKQLMKNSRKRYKKIGS